MDNKKYFEQEIKPGSTNDFITKNLDLVYTEKNQDGIVVTMEDGKTRRFKLGIVASRLKDRAYLTVQQRTISTFDREKVESQIKKEILLDINSKGIANIDKETLEYAIEGKTRDYIKKNFDNDFFISQDEFLNIAQIGNNNLSYIKEEIVPAIEELSQITEWVVERSVNENYEKVEKRIPVPTMPLIGFATNKNTTDPAKKNQPFIRVSDELLCRIVGINKNAPYATIFLATKEKLDSIYTGTLYEILSNTINMMNRFDKKEADIEFEYMPLLGYFGSNYGKKKKRNPKYNPETMSADKEFLKDKRTGNQIWETNADGSVMYDEEYRKTYNDFKKFVLNPALLEFNSKAGKRVELLELKRTKTGKISKTGTIEKVIFKLYDDRDIRTNEYIAIQYFFKANTENMTIAQIKTGLLTKKSENETFNRDIILSGLKTSDELIEVELSDVNHAYSDLKTIFKSNHPALSNYSLDDKLYVVVDKSELIDNKPIRLGNNCIESLEKLKETHPDIIDEILKKSNMKSTKDFIPFTIVFNSETIKVNNRNYEENQNKIEFLLKENNHRAFKGFKNKNTKQVFYDTFLKE